jgi:hypothetical protein
MIALNYGSCMHVALPLAYQQNGESVQDACARAVSAFQVEWDKYSFGEDDPKRNTGLTIRRLAQFAEVRSLANRPYKILEFDFDAPTEETVSKYEVPFLIDIGGSLPLAGRIDLPIIWLDTGEIWADDYKTASEISDRLFANFNFSPQACGYTIALAHITGKTVQGLAVEAIRVSKTNIETTIGFSYVQEHQVDKFIEWANMQARLILHYNDTGEWPINPAMCVRDVC